MHDDLRSPAGDLPKPLDLGLQRIDVRVECFTFPMGLLTNLGGLVILASLLQFVRRAEQLFQPLARRIRLARTADRRPFG